ncbi:hypothetical protein AB9P05_01555 [Roseivirga sp. BDSF3-8]|uniref:hypothetical protein n=1 Tax=Roseivirga sp. BDSF3-8 TaxID=3241598 RepID=UPI003531AB1D
MLKELRRETYDDTLDKVIKDIESKGFTDIRADYGDYEAPAKLVSQTKNDEYIPDATAVNRYGEKYYFEISRRMKEPEKLVNKWKLLDTVARIKNGELKIFVPHGSMKFTQDIIKQHNIEAELLKI